MTRRANFAAPHLLERFDGFAYDYRMRCDCGSAVVVTAETYYREQSVAARVPCQHCAGEVHFGPAVALLRDENDPALDNAAVSRFAWYHTSTWADWPSDDFAAEAEDGARRTAEHYGFDPAGVVERATTKALHVGTYETSIENMLRRMHDEGDDDKQFYLYRVGLNVEPGRINDGYRDENAEEAAQVTLADLDAANVDALRYVNVHEATGSLSLAVRPTCLDSVQRLAVPIVALAKPPDPDLRSRLEVLDSRRAELDAQAGELPDLSVYQRVMMRAGKMPVTDGLLDRLEAIEAEQRAVDDERVRRLVAHHLIGVSPVVADAFVGALGAWHNGRSDSERHSDADRFGAVAALLTRARHVVQLVSKQAVKS